MASGRKKEKLKTKQKTRMHLAVILLRKTHVDVQVSVLSKRGLQVAEANRLPARACVLCCVLPLVTVPYDGLEQLCVMRYGGSAFAPVCPRELAECNTGGVASNTGFVSLCSADSGRDNSLGGTWGEVGVWRCPVHCRLLSSILACTH